MSMRHITVGAGSSLGAEDATISDAVRFGDLLFLSGRAAVDPATLEVVSDDFEQQTHAVLRDIEAVLEAAGSDWPRVLRIECFLADAGDFAVWNRIWRERFAAPRPARTTVVCEFAVPGILIELQVTAAVASVEP
jgi:2-iminobutanoate/2-iminopropanoate deaminase